MQPNTPQEPWGASRGLPRPPGGCCCCCACQPSAAGGGPPQAPLLGTRRSSQLTPAPVASSPEPEPPPPLIIMRSTWLVTPLRSLPPLPAGLAAAASQCAMAGPPLPLHLPLAAPAGGQLRRPSFRPWPVVASAAEGEARVTAERGRLGTSPVEVKRWETLLPSSPEARRTGGPGKVCCGDNGRA